MTCIDISPREIETLSLQELSHEYGIEPAQVIKMICDKAVTGQIQTLPLYNEGLLIRLKSHLPTCTFEEGLDLVFDRGTCHGHTLTQVSELCGRPDRAHLLYVILRFALEDEQGRSKYVDLDRKIQIAFPNRTTIPNLDRDPRTSNSSLTSSFISYPDDSYNPLYFSRSELGRYFNLTLSSEISRASRKFRLIRGHYLIRRELQSSDMDRYSNTLTYLYRPVSKDEKIYHMYHEDKVCFEDLLECSGLSPEALDELVSGPCPPTLNPFDRRSHQGELNLGHILEDWSELLDRGISEEDHQDLFSDYDKVCSTESDVVRRLQTLVEYHHYANIVLCLETLQSYLQIEDMGELVTSLRSVQDSLGFKVTVYL